MLNVLRPPSGGGPLFRTKSNNNGGNSSNNNNNNNNGTISSRKGSGARHGRFTTPPSQWRHVVVAQNNKAMSLRTMLTACVVLSVVCVLGAWFWFLADLIQNDTKGVYLFHGRKWRFEHAAAAAASASAVDNRTTGKTTASAISGTTRTRSEVMAQTTRKAQQKKGAATSNSNPFCAFRRYPAHRYYKLTDANQPDFLVSDDSEYIYGAWPLMLQQQQHEPPTKLCVDQSPWLSPTVNGLSKQQQQKQKRIVWPFADGTNPSILHMHRVQQQAPVVAESLLLHFPNTEYIVTVCMTNSQCTWKDSTSSSSTTVSSLETTTTTDLPDLQQSKPDTVRTVIQLLDAQFATLTETTVWLARDAAWGKLLLPRTDAADNTARTTADITPGGEHPHHHHLPALDDARLFVHDSKIYVSYREGPGFGYESQVLNPIHFGFDAAAAAAANNGAANDAKKNQQLSATILASESSTFCCGRNMALLSDFGTSAADLYALTWVDPVTVEKVDTTPLNNKQQQQQQQRTNMRKRKKQHRTRRLRLRLLETSLNVDTVEQQEGSGPRQVLLSQQHEQHRRMKAQRHKSHIHGTNAFMVPLPDGGTAAYGSAEFLGVAHFHRPNDRKPNVYARFGHHYTHAFYTVSAAANSNDLSSFRLMGLSQEFVLPAIHKPDDAEIIQFVSGLEYNPVTQQVVLAYGINDCEAAVTTMDLSEVRSMLKPVPAGKQVVDYMAPLTAATAPLTPKQ